MQRLRTRPQFQAALAGGVGARTAHFVLHSCPFEALAPAGGGEQQIGCTLAEFASSQPVLGAMVPKRWAKRAVTRNTIKRQIYAVSSQLSPTLAPRAHVVRLRAAFDRKEFISATSEVLKAAVRAELLDLFARATTMRARN